jgi:Sporulation factor SpoIIGA.
LKTYFYVDFYFILNFIMNLFLVMATAMLRQKRCRMIRFLIVSSIDAVFSVVFTYFLWENGILQFCVALFQMGVFVFLALKGESFFIWLRDMACFLFLAFFTGGAVGVLQGVLIRNFNILQAPSARWLFIAVALLAILFFLFRWELISQGQGRKNIRTVRVVHQGREAEVEALYDTGNQLVSPYTGEGVVIISKGLSEEIGLPCGQNPILIPYHSIGGSGLLKAYRLECIQMQGGICKKGLLAAVSEELDCRQRIQMILNITWS